MLIILQWWTSTRVKLISTQCASSLCSSSAWVSSCCCCRKTGTSASSSSAPSCENVTILRRATQRRAPPQASTGEGEGGPPCQHLHTDSMKYHHVNTHTCREGDTLTPVSVDVGTYDSSSLSCRFPRDKVFIRHRKCIIHWVYIH